MALSPGNYLDRYRLVAQVGEGGQGTVWKAVDDRTRQVVALKLHQLSPADRSPDDPPDSTAFTHVQRLRREAESLQQLDHPSLVRCLGMFEDPQRDLLGLVLEWIDGQPLATAAKQPTFTEAHRMWLLGHLIRALAHLHQREIVHRDLKFNNVLVSHGFWESPAVPENVKLVDLGVAAPVGNPNPLTIAGAFVGTSAYVAPEIVMRGKNPALSASTASDVFAFGVLGWRLLTGKHPTGLSLKADFAQFVAFYQLALRGDHAWPALGSVDGPWGHVLRRCLRIEAHLRPQSASSVVDLLEGRAPLESIPEESTSQDEPPTRLYNQHDDQAPTSVHPAYRAPLPLPVPSSVVRPSPSFLSEPTPRAPTLPPSSSSLTPAPPSSSSYLASASPSSISTSPPPSSGSYGSPLPSVRGAQIPAPAPLGSSIPPTPPVAPAHHAPTIPSAQLPLPSPAPSLPAVAPPNHRLLIGICIVASLVLVGGLVALFFLRQRATT
jgi:serine/threonine protein kinase